MSNNNDWLAKACLLVVGEALLSGESGEGITDALNKTFDYGPRDDRRITRSATCAALNRKSTWTALAELFSEEELGTMRRLRRGRQGTGAPPAPVKKDGGIIIFGNPAPSKVKVGGSAPPGDTSLPLEPAGSVTIHTLGARMCKWPIGDPESDGFTFCGRSTASSRIRSSYCREHDQVAYAPQATRKRKPKAVIDDLRLFSRVN